MAGHGWRKATDVTVKLVQNFRFFELNLAEGSEHSTRS